MKKKLTAVTIAALPEGNYTDAACAGLTLRVGARAAPGRSFTGSADG